MSELNKEWFEPGPDGKSTFGQEFAKNSRHAGSVGECLSAAFRALGMYQAQKIENALIELGGTKHG